MPRRKRADEAGSIYQALNRGNARQTIFHKDEDDEALLRVLSEGLERYAVELFGFTRMSNHWHLVITPRRTIAASTTIRIFLLASSPDRLSSRS